MAKDLGMTYSNMEDLAWAAGLFEGEGFFSFSKVGDGHVRAHAGIRMTDPDILERFVIAVGMGHVGNAILRPPNKPIYGVDLTRFETAQALGAMLWKWLGPRRREQVRTGLLRYKHRTLVKQRYYPGAECLVPGCNRRPKSKGLCDAHNQRLKAGNLDPRRPTSTHR